MIPKFKDYFYPFLESIKDGNIHTLKEIKVSILQLLTLTSEDLAEKTKGGRIKHDDRVKWAITYLKGVELINSPKKCCYQITSLGLQMLELYGKNFDLNILRDLKGYKELSRKTNPSNSHWVEGHYRYDGTYIAGYYSNFKAKGIRKSRPVSGRIIELLED